MYQDTRNIDEEVKARQVWLQTEAHKERVAKECAGLAQAAEKPGRPARKQLFRLVLCPRSAR